jgi:hypothetical protein
LARQLTLPDALWLAASTDRPIHFFIAEAPDGSNSALRHLVQTENSPASESGDRADPPLEPIEMVLRANGIACVAGQELLRKLHEDVSERARLEEVLLSTGALAVTVQVESASPGAIFIQANKLRWRWPRQLPARVVVRFCSPIDLSAHSPALRDAMAGLSRAGKAPA